MDFELSTQSRRLQGELRAFMASSVYPAEPVFAEQVATSGDRHADVPVLKELQREARDRGLWNLFLSARTEWGGGLSNVDYAPLAEITGRSPLAPEALNCSSPDTGNMEILNLFGTDKQKHRWLRPLLDAQIRSVFAMTEPGVASSDATNMECRIKREGDHYVIDGRKCWISGAARRRARVAIVMGKTDPGAQPHRQQSMVLVPMDTPGVTVVRDMCIFGYNDHEGHREMTFEDVRIPISNMLGAEGDGFLIAQSRLGPGRLHHCMRALGAAERALELMCQRAHERKAFDEPLAEKGVIREWVADSRLEIDQARLLTYRAAWLMDTQGSKAARGDIAAIKIVAPSVACKVIDRAIQVCGAAGLSQDFPLAAMYGASRALRIVDGPDEVHRRTLGRLELAKYGQDTILIT